MQDLRYRNPGSRINLLKPVIHFPPTVRTKLFCIVSQKTAFVSVLKECFRKEASIILFSPLSTAFSFSTVENSVEIVERRLEIV